MTDDKVNEYRLKTVEDMVVRMSKIISGNGEKGIAEIVKILADRMEQRKETHDKDVTRIEKACEMLGTNLDRLGGKFERMLWWMLTQSAILLIGIIVIVFEIMVKR